MAGVQRAVGGPWPQVTRRAYKQQKYGSRRVFLVEAPGIEPEDDSAGRMRERYGDRRVGRVGAVSEEIEGSVLLVYPSALSWSPVPELESGHT